MLINQKDIFDTIIKGKRISRRKVKTDSLLEQAQSNINNWVNRNIDSYEILAKQLTEQAELDKTNANELMKLADALRRR